MFCPNCGTFVPDGSLFCPTCGTSFQTQPQPETAQPQPETMKESAPAVDRGKFGLLAIILAGVSVFFLMFGLSRFVWTWFMFLAAGALLAFTIIKKFYRYDHMMMAIPMTAFALAWMIRNIWVIAIGARGAIKFTGVMAQLFMLGAAVLLWLVGTGLLKNKKLFSLIIFGCCVILTLHFTDVNAAVLARNGWRSFKILFVSGYGNALFHLVYVLMFLTDEEWFKEEIGWIRSWFKKKPAAAPAAAPQAAPAPVNQAAPAGRVFCPVCGKEQEPGSVFCSGCGTRLPNM